MAQTPKRPATALDEIREILSMYSKFNPREDYITLLDSLERLTMELREEMRPKRQRKRRTKLKETQFSHGPARISQPTNMATRSRVAESATDLSFLQIRSHLRPRSLLPRDAELPSKLQETTTTDRLNVADSQSEMNPISHRGSRLQGEAEPVATKTGTPDTDKLKQVIENCKETYRGKTFIVNGDGYSETVNPDEIDRFFSLYQEETCLANFNLMPLLFSFRWPWTTLVLHSFHTSFITLDNESQRSNTRVRWPLSPKHDRVILPCCIHDHWTLYDVDLKGNVIRHYDSLAGDVSGSAEVVVAIKERLASAMEGWETPNRDFTVVNGASQQQKNGSDCGIYMIYNADCLASNQDPLEEQIDGVQLRYRYLLRLLELERQGRSERQVVDMILPVNKTLKIKRRRIPGDISDDASDQDQQGSRKSRRVDWSPPSHLGSEDAWIEERDHLAATILEQGCGRSKRECRERAEELLQMIEAIGCREIMTSWDDAIAEDRLDIRVQTAESTAEAICQLIERTQVRSFKDKVLLRIGKWIFTMKILQDVEKLKREGAPSRQSVLKADADVRGHALKRAFTNFMQVAHPELQKPDINKQRDAQYSKYRNWWREGQIWVLLYYAFGAAVLLLIPAGQRAERGFSVSNKQYVDIKSSEREPFISSLQKLRPDLKRTVSELDNHLEVLKDDIADLLGRLRHPRMSQELKSERRKDNS